MRQVRFLAPALEYIVFNTWLEEEKRWSLEGRHFTKCVWERSKECKDVRRLCQSDKVMSRNSARERGSPSGWAGEERSGGNVRDHQSGGSKKGG